MRLLILFLAINGVLMSCNSKKTSKVIAKVKTQELYLTDLQGALPKGTSKADSTIFAERFIDSWIRKQLLFLNAKENTKTDETEINRKVEDYKYALLTYEFEKQYLSKKLTSNITDKEIQEFYDKNKQEFELRQNIIQAFLVKVPLSVAGGTTLKNLMNSTKKEDLETLSKYCSQKAVSYTLSDSTWVDFEQLTEQTPFRQIPNKVDFLKNNRFVEMRDSSYSYYLKIKDFKISEQTSPLEFVKERIKSMILSQRKTMIIQELETELYKKAQENKQIEIIK
jgi:hypothetical protein